jgi:TatD DNase family protein
MLTDIHSHDAQHFPNQKKVLSIQLHPETDLVSVLNALSPDMLVSAGVHPWHASEWSSANTHALSAMLHTSQLAFIGEIGLDNVCGVPFSDQIRVFEDQLRIADSIGVSVLIHNVGYQAEIVAMKKKYTAISAWILHGFRGKPHMAKQFLVNGFYLSFGPKHPLETIRLCPLERLLLETDDSGADLTHLFELVSQEKGLSVQELDEGITRNVGAIYRK